MPCAGHTHLPLKQAGEWKPQVQLSVRQSAAISRDRDEHTAEWGGLGLLVCSAVWQGGALECVRLRKQKQIDKQTMQPLPHAACRLNWPEGAQEKAHSAL